MVRGAITQCILRSETRTSEYHRLHTVGRPTNENAGTEFMKKVTAKGDRKQGLGLGEIQKQMEDAVKAIDFTTREMRRHEESRIGKGGESQCWVCVARRVGALTNV